MKGRRSLGDRVNPNWGGDTKKSIKWGNNRLLIWEHFTLTSGVKHQKVVWALEQGKSKSKREARRAEKKKGRALFGLGHIYTLKLPKANRGPSGRDASQMGEPGKGKSLNRDKAGDLRLA